MENKINEETVKKDIARLKFSMQENNIIHNSYQREKRELECIRQGDMEGMEKCITEPYGGKLGTLSRDVLRSDKNVAMCAMAIYARAAIDGGIISDEAFSAGDSWAIRIDEAKSREEVALYVQDLARFFTRMVYEHAQVQREKKEQENKLVAQCKYHIFQHMHERLTVKTIAKALYVNPDYLSHLFVRCEGVKISRYILEEKVKLAKNLLMYSPYDCKSISNYLGFSSQSHFGKIFKEYTGISPNEYKLLYGKDTF